MLNHTLAWCLVATVVLHPAVQEAPAAQQPPVRFKVNVDFVEIDAIVTDANGGVVRDLTKDEFQILEDGKPQAIGAFMKVDIPIVRTERSRLPSTAEPDVFSNTREFDGRLFVLVLDDLQTAHANTSRVRGAARRFVEEYAGTNDLIGVVHTSGFVARQDLTASRPRVIAAIDRFTGSKLLSATLLKMEDAQLQQNVPPEFRKKSPQDTAEAVRAHRARTSLGVLLGLSDYLGGIRGRRKSIVYIGEGIDYDVREKIEVDEAGVTRDTRAIHAAMTDLVAAASRANVAVYTLDPRGLATGMEEAIATSTPSVSGTNVPYGPGMTTLMDEMVRSHASLRTLAEETGGLAFLNNNDDRVALSRILEDSSTYYILGYHPKDARRDGLYRRIDVRVTRPGMAVRSRRGYVAPDARKAKPAAPVAAGVSASLREALDSPLPVSGLGLSVSATPFQGQAPNASVAIVIELDPARLTFVQRDGRFHSDLEILVATFDPHTGKPSVLSLDAARLRLRPETHALVAREGVRITRRISVPPGRQRLQVGAREANGGAVGTIVADLDVPELFRPEMQMSGLVLASQAAAVRVPTANQDALLKDALPASPTTTREFEGGDTLALYAEVYPNKTKTPYRVSIRTSVRADDGRVLFSAEEERQLADPAGAPASGHQATIPLAGFATGRYVLRVEARRLLSDPQMTARELEFRVR